MSRLWEYEPKRRLGRRTGFLEQAQSTGFQRMVRDSLITRGLDPDAMADLAAPAVATKPITKDIIREVVPESNVRATETALRPTTAPTPNRAPTAGEIRRYLKENYPGREDSVEVEYVPGEGTYVVEKDQTGLIPEEDTDGSSTGFLKGIASKVAGAITDVASVTPVKQALSILDILDIPRQKIGKPIARGILEPIALVVDAADALSPDNLSALPRIVPTGGQIRGSTSVEILSFITDPLNLTLFAGKAIQAAKGAMLGTRLGLKEAQALRSVVPKAERLIAKEAGKAGKVAAVDDDLVATMTRAFVEDDPKLIRARGGAAPRVQSFLLHNGKWAEVEHHDQIAYILGKPSGELGEGGLKTADDLERYAEDVFNEGIQRSGSVRVVNATDRLNVEVYAGRALSVEQRQSLMGAIKAHPKGLATIEVTERLGAKPLRSVDVRGPMELRRFLDDFARGIEGPTPAGRVLMPGEVGFRKSLEGKIAKLRTDMKEVVAGRQPGELDTFDLRRVRFSGDEVKRLQGMLDDAPFEPGGFPTRFAGQARKIEGGPPPGLKKAVPIKETPEVTNLRAKVTADGGNPPPPPPPRLPGEPPGLLPGGQSPSMSLWRTIESGLFLSPRADNLMRKTAEIIGDAPGIRLFMKAITGPAALARINPEIRAGVTYRRVQGVMEAELGQRLVGAEESFHTAFQIGRDTSKIVVGGKEVAFGDFASDVLMGTRIGAKRARYPVTEAQRNWITSQKTLIDDLARQYEHISGDKIRLLGDDYWPRFVQGDDGRVAIKGRVGAKQSPVKDRHFSEMEDSIAKGATYASPTETVQLYGRAVQKMMRDKMLIRVIKEDKIGKPVIQQITQEIKALKSQIKAVKPTTAKDALEVEVLRNKLSNLQAVRASKKRALIPAKQVLGPGFGKQLLEPDAAKVMQDIIGPGMGGKVGKGLRSATWIASVPRFIVTGAMDVGQFFIQGATLLATDPVSWSKAVGHSLVSLVSPDHWANFLKNSPEAIEAAKYGIGRGGIEFLEITKRSAALGRVPGAGAVKAVLGAAPRSFETFIEGSRIFNFNALSRVQRGAVGREATGLLPTTARAAAGITKSEIEGEMFRLAGYVKTKLGTTDLMGLGLATTQRQVESAFLLYSPRYTRSVFGMLGWAVSNGVPARDAQRALGTMLVGGLSAFYGFARATGMSHDEAVERINPASGGKFLSLPMGDNEYGFGSAYRATLGFMGRLLKEDSWDFDSWEDAAFDNPLANYLRSRTAPTTGTLVDFIEGEDFMGKEVDLNAFIDDPGRMLDYATGKFLPLNLEALFEARGPLEQRLLAGATETVGGRAFPRSPYSLFQEAQESVFQEKRALGESPYSDFDSFEDLAKENAPAVAVIKTDPRVQRAQERLEHESRYRVKTKEGVGFERLEETRVAQRDLQLEDDNALNLEEMAVSVWKDNFRGRQREFFARRDTIVKDFGLKFGANKAGVNVAIDAYFSVDGEDFKNLMTGGVDWDRFFTARDATLEDLSPANRKLVKEYLRRYDTPTVREFRKAQSDLDEYWAVEDLAWSRLRENDEFNPYLSMNDYLAAKQQALIDSGMTPIEAANTLSQLAVVRSITSTVAKLRNRYRLQHPTADALLVTWYGLSPARPSGGGLKRTGRLS